MRALIMGCPGSGKVCYFLLEGTLSKRISDTFNLKVLSSGDILRSQIAQKSALGLEVKALVAGGHLVPDDLISQLVFSALETKSSNWLLDGFPRTVNQAEILDSKLQSIGQRIDLVINLNVPETVILQRIKGLFMLTGDRWIHQPSGRVYNLSFNPPKVPGLDDFTKEPLTKRDDDNEIVFKTRLDEYHKMTMSLIDYYSNKQILQTFSGETSNEIWPQILNSLNKH